MKLHPLVHQLYFTRSEFLGAVEGVSGEEAGKRFLPMNCISWNVGHLAWQEQRYFLYYAQGQLPLPEIDKQFRYGGAASTPKLSEMLAAWQEITQAANPLLESLTVEKLQEQVVLDGQPSEYIYGSLLLRVIYHYWYHTGENMAIRQMLGHSSLPEFVGNIDDEAPYRAE